MKADFDVIIIGGGPSGLTAAYFLAKFGQNVVLFEQQKEKGMMVHPCGGMTNPINNYIRFERREDGIYYREADFLFTNDMILAYPKQMIFTAPDGSQFGMQITEDGYDRLIFQVDKQKVLVALADRAEKAGAILHYGTRVSQLIQESGNVEGVIINGEPIKSKLVISAEGLSRKFSNQAGLFTSPPISYCFIYARYYSNLNLKESEIGQFGYFGRQYLDIPRSSLLFHSYGYNKAMILVSVFLDEMRFQYLKRCDNIEEIAMRIRRLNEIIKDGSFTKAKGCWMVLQKPDKLVSQGYIGIGDTIAPLGHSSISIGMLMGRDVADLCQKAAKGNKFDQKTLESFNSYLKSKIFKGVQFEANLIMAMNEYNDEELNKLSESLSDINLEPFMASSTVQMLCSSIKFMFKKKVLKNWKLIQRLFK